MYSGEDRKFMEQALQLAARASGRTSPNPLVGCVIVKDGRVVGEGFHQKAGTPHAEVHALAAAGEKARESTVYVNLEPCSHFGRTPPCADALIRAGVKRVVVAMVDPNPLVSGRGINRLRAAGIQVDVGLLSEEARILNEVFVKSIQTGFPFVVYKAAMTLDGKLATNTGDSRWVSSEKSREYAHYLRNRYDVIMVGSETVLKDDPALTCRIPGGRDPVRLIVDGQLRIPENARVLSSSESAPCILATTMAAPQDKIKQLKNRQGLEIWQYETSRYVPLPQLFKDLVWRGWTSVLLEGGGGLAGVLMKEKLIDKIEFFLAPKFVGNGPSPLSGLPIQRMAEAVPVDIRDVSLETGDLRVTGYIRYT